MGEHRPRVIAIPQPDLFIPQQARFALPDVGGQDLDHFGMTPTEKLGQSLGRDGGKVGAEIEG
jgi:hypothetical protein